MRYEPSVDTKLPLHLLHYYFFHYRTCDGSVSDNGRRFCMVLMLEGAVQYSVCDSEYYERCGSLGNCLYVMCYSWCWNIVLHMLSLRLGCIKLTWSECTRQMASQAAYCSMLYYNLVQPYNKHTPLSIRNLIEREVQLSCASE